MLVNKANRPHIVIKDGIRTLITNWSIQSVRPPLDTNQSLSLVAESRDDNVRSNDLHEELNDDEHDRKELFCNACRWNNWNVDMSCKR